MGMKGTVQSYCAGVNLRETRGFMWHKAEAVFADAIVDLLIIMLLFVLQQEMCILGFVHVFQSAVNFT